MTRAIKINPERMVKTIRGKLLPRIACAKFRDGYYEKEVDCIKIETKWYKKFSSKIAYDFETKKYRLLSIVDTPVFYFKDGEILPAYTKKKENLSESQKKLKNIYSQYFHKDLKIAGSSINAFILKEKIKFFNSYWLEKISNYNEFYIIIDPVEFFKNFPGKFSFKKDEYLIDYIENCHFNTNGLPYHVLDSNKEILTEITNNFHNPIINYMSKDPKLGAYLQEYVNLLGNHKFGLEYETKRGWLQPHSQKKLGVVALRDGSLQGGVEYSSVVLNNFQVIPNIIMNCFMYRLTHSFDSNCSFHIHISDNPKERGYAKALAFYKLCCAVQEELLSIVPPRHLDKTYLKLLESKGKSSYCGPLTPLKNIVPNKINGENIADAYRRLAFYFCENDNAQAVKSYNGNLFYRHPKSRKWEQNKRYKAINLMNYVLEGPGTIEFRQHTMTFNVYKMLAWLFITNAIIKFVDIDMPLILETDPLKISLYHILKTVYSGSPEGDELVDFLLNYINQRKSDYQNFLEKNSFPYTYLEEIRTDSIFVANGVPRKLQYIIKCFSELAEGTFN